MKTAALLVVAGLAAAASAGQTTVVLSFDNTPSFDGLGAPGNFFGTFDLNALAGGVAGAQVSVLGVAWDLEITALGASWLSEPTLAFDDQSLANPDAFFLSPGAGSDFPGVAAFSSPTIFLGDVGLNPLVLGNGVLTIELFESFNDVTGAADGSINGTVTLTIDFTPVPAPASAGLLGLAGLAAARRRR